MVIVVLVLVGVSRAAPAEGKKKADALLEKEYGAYGKTTEEILSHEIGKNWRDVFGALEWRITQKSEARGESSLTETERQIVAAYWVELEVGNGGFDQYFNNSAGDSAATALAGLKAMGATAAAAILERAMAVFPGGKPPADRGQRGKIMEEIDAKATPIWNKCDKDLDELKVDIAASCLAYAKKKRAEIILP